MNRITQKDLEYMVKRINEITGSPLEPYTKDEQGKFKANVGNYHLDWAYGGVKLERFHPETGGSHEISTVGYGTKRELYNWMRAYISGIETK